MLGFLLLAGGTFFDEAAGSLGKRLMVTRLADAFSLPFINHLGFVLFFAGQVLFFPSVFVFDPASWPFILVRIALELLQAWFTMEALKRASRSTFGFLRVLTIPLLLISDVFLLGSHILPLQYAGLAIIAATLLWLFRQNGNDRKGAGFVLASAVNAVFTLTLFKYDIEHFNSVAAEQLIVGAGMLIGLYLIERYHFGHNPFNLLKKREAWVEAVCIGAAAVLISYGYVFLAVSIATAMKRALGVIWAVLFGRQYFHEDHFGTKIVACIAMLTGLILLTVSYTTL